MRFKKSYVYFISTVVVSALFAVIFCVRIFTSKHSNNVSEEILNNLSEDENLEEKIEAQEETPDFSAMWQGDYKDLYKDLYCIRPNQKTPDRKVAYLTFDDGPSERTAEVLDILKEKNVKATFFVVGNTSDFGKKMMKRIVAEGHTIGVHTYTHEYNEIYANVKAYLDDFYKIFTTIKEVTSITPEIFRFPGGSVNGFNEDNYREIISEITRRGFDYFDWNLSVGDAVSANPTPVSTIVSNVLSCSAEYDQAVVLMHDSSPKRTTVEGLPQIIDGLREQGFALEKLTHDVNPADYSFSRQYR